MHLHPILFNTIRISKFLKAIDVQAFLEFQLLQFGFPCIPCDATEMQLLVLAYLLEVIQKFPFEIQHLHFYSLEILARNISLVNSYC